MSNSSKISAYQSAKYEILRCDPDEFNRLFNDNYMLSCPMLLAFRANEMCKDVVSISCVIVSCYQLATIIKA